MGMRNPVHPGAMVREDCLKALGLSVTEAARRLGVGRPARSSLINEKSPVSIEMAHRLAKTFGSTPDHCMRMQLAHALPQSRGLKKKIKVKRIEAA